MPVSIRIHLTAEQRQRRDEELGQRGLCRGDPRFTQPSLRQEAIDEMLAVCHRCPVRLATSEAQSGCLDWAMEQRAPVGFVVAGGKRWLSWTNCEICAVRTRGLPRCLEHGSLEEPEVDRE